MRAKTNELIESATAELADVEALGGAFEAIDELKMRLVRSQSERVRRIETGEQRVIGVNAFTETADSPLTGDDELESIMKVDPKLEAELADEVAHWRTRRDQGAVRDGARRVAAGVRGRRAGRQHHGGHHCAGPRRGDDR